MNNKNILVVSPHPDDMEIGMGGTVSKLITQGFNIISCVATDGRRSTSVSGLSQDEVATIRRMEAREAALILGINELFFWNLPHLKSTGNLKEMREKLEEVISHFKPAEIFATHPTIDKHPTHQTVSKLLLDVLRKMGKKESLIPKRIRCYEVWTPFERYDRVEDISDYIEKKKAAINAHKSQLEYKDYTEGILGLNRYRAVFNNTSGVTEMKYAEVFLELSLGAF